ncbi:MAG TPA: MFS transporter [Mycobacteriales bacterium]|nr:MFS transporter [Mycobacteriales bacterium]
MRAYLPLLRLPGAVLFCLSALVGRMPISMLGIGSVLLVQDRRGSFTLAGAVAAAYALGLAVGGPLVSRLVDRRGQARVLPWALALSALGMLAVIAAAGSELPGWTLLASAAVAGGALPPLGACVRARWASALRRADRAEHLSTAFALESVIDEVVFIAGPAIVVGLAVLVDPAVGLLAALLLCVAGTVAFVLQRSTEPPVEPPTPGGTRSAITVSGLRTTALAMVCVGVVFGSLEVVMVAFAGEQGRPGAAGVLLPLVALGSGVAGLAYGARAWRTALDRRFLIALAALSVGVVPLLLAPGIAWMAPAALLAGVAISPTLIASFGLVERLVPVAARTEGFTWLNSGLGVGVAGGSALGGALADGPGARAAFLVCFAGAVLALGTALVGRRTLTPARAVSPAPS